jgi:hypothetical protein
MEVVRLILDYLKALTIPTTAILLVGLFRGEFRAWISKSRFPANGTAEIPGLGKYSWGATTARVSDNAAGAVESMSSVQGLVESVGTPATGEESHGQETESEPSPDRLPNNLSLRLAVGHRNWGELRALAVENPVAGVLDAWRTVAYKVYERAYAEKVSGFPSDWEKDPALAALRLGASQRMAAVLADLHDLKNRAEAGEGVTRTDALEYIQAAETVLQPWS